MTDLLEQKPLLDSYLNGGPRPLSTFSFVALFAWCDFFDFELKLIKDCLCVFAHGRPGSFLYLPPLGKSFDASTTEAVFKHMPPSAANRIENIPENLLPAFERDRYNQYSKPAEYVYRKADLITLKGNAYKSQRHDCNHFCSHHGEHVFEPYREGDLGPCLELYEEWARQRAKGHSEDVYRCMLDENRLVHERLLRSSQDLGLVARVLRVNGKISGYTFGYALDENTFCLYAEIADLKLTGAAAYMFRSFCADGELKNFSRINTMDDFAMPKVAAAKQAYHPSEMVNSYTVSMKA